MKGKLTVLMITAFVDMLGLAMVIPLLPFYATKLGASATIVGVLIAAFSIAQLGSCRWSRHRLRPHTLGTPRTRHRIRDLLHPRQHLRWRLSARVARGNRGDERTRSRSPDECGRGMERDRAPERARAATDLDLRDRDRRLLRHRADPSSA